MRIRIKDGIMINVNASVKVSVRSVKNIVAGILAHVFIKYC